MTDPQPPTDDEKTAARNEAKGLLKEAFSEWVTERQEEDDEKNPKRTTKPENSIFKSLFGG